MDAQTSMNTKPAITRDSDDHTAVAPHPHKPATTGLITVEPLKKHEMQPSYALTTGEDPGKDSGWYGAMINSIGVVVGTLGSIPCCFCCPNPFKEVQQGNVGLVTRFGQFYKAVDPGLTKINPLSEALRVVNVQITVISVPRQVAMTKDNVNVEIDSVIYYHIRSPYRAAFGVQDIRTALIERAQSTLRQVVGARTLQDTITQREEVAREIEEILETVAEAWGVQIESLLIKDILFSTQLQESLSSAAQQKRIGEAKVIAARAEVDAARLMRDAADILSSPAAIQLRQLEALQNMARQSSSKVIFVPMSLQSMGSAQAAQLAQGAQISEDASGVNSGNALVDSNALYQSMH